MIDIIYYTTVVILAGLIVGGYAAYRYQMLGDYMGTVTSISSESVFVRHEQPLKLDARLMGPSFFDRLKKVLATSNPMVYDGNGLAVKPWVRMAINRKRG